METVVCRVGRPYTWVAGRGIDTPLGHVPPALLVLLVPRQVERQPQPTIRPATPGHPYGRQALTQETTAVATAAKGTRNHQLWRSARSLHRLVAGGVLEETEVERALLHAAEQSGLLREEPQATERTLQSARQIGMSQPRGIPLPPGRGEISPGPAGPPPVDDRTTMEHE